jgi:hypothetical protein
MSKARNRKKSRTRNNFYASIQLDLVFVFWFLLKLYTADTDVGSLYANNSAIKASVAEGRRIRANLQFSRFPVICIPPSLSPPLPLAIPHNRVQNTDISKQVLD